MRNIFLVLFFFLIVLTSGCSSTYVLPDGHKSTSDHLEEHEKQKFHIHANFLVFVNDIQVDFSVMMYQLRDKDVHVEDGIGEVVHIHKRGVTVGDFFETLGIEFNSNCIIIPIEGSYCNSGDEKLSFYINGIENDEFENYEMKNIDRILISYGNGDIEKQLDQVNSLRKTS